MEASITNNKPPTDEDFQRLQALAVSGAERIRGLVKDMKRFRDMIEELERRVLQYEDEVEEVRAGMLEAKIVLHPIRRIPNKILEDIFRIVVETEAYRGGSEMLTRPSSSDTRHPPWTLARVCSLWRYIVEHCPGLWVHVHVDSSFRQRTDLKSFLRRFTVHPNEGSPRLLTVEELIIRQLSFSRGCPLHVSFTNRLDGTHSLAAPFGILSSHAPRWETFTLFVRSDKGVLSLLSLRSHLVSLRETKLIASSSQRLKRNQVTPAGLKAWSTELPTSTEFRLEYHTRGPLRLLPDVGPDGLAPHTNRVLLSKLSKLVVLGDDSERFLDAVVLPSVQAIEIRYPINLQCLFGLQSASEFSSLTRLSFQMNLNLTSDSELVKLFYEIPSLEHLEIDLTIDSDSETLPPLNEFARHLMTHHLSFLPGLKTLKLTAGDTSIITACNLLPAVRPLLHLESSQPLS